MITGNSRNAGKTTLTTSLAKSFLRKGIIIQAYKVGVDKVDPLKISEASQKPCLNLDSNLQSIKEIKELISYGARDSDFLLIESVAGLRLEDGKDSMNLKIAKALEIDFLHIHSYLSDTVYDVSFFSTREMEEIKAFQIDISKLDNDQKWVLDFIFENAHTFKADNPFQSGLATKTGKRALSEVAVAVDEAFGNHSNNNLHFLRQKLPTHTSFSPLHFIPPSVEPDVIYFPHGIIEHHVRNLTQLRDLQIWLTEMMENGTMIYAEGDSIRLFLEEYYTVSGEKFHMLGFYKGASYSQKTSVVSGYHEFTNLQDSFFGKKGTSFLGFYNSFFTLDIKNNYTPIFSTEDREGNQIMDGFMYKNLLISYFNTLFSANARPFFLE